METVMVTENQKIIQRIYDDFGVGTVLAMLARWLGTSTGTGYGRGVWVRR
jgi:hypothetical protein